MNCMVCEFFLKVVKKNSERSAKCLHLSCYPLALVSENVLVCDGDGGFPRTKDSTARTSWIAHASGE